MDVIDCFRERMKNAESLFDVISVCYDTLISIDSREAVSIRAYRMFITTNEEKHHVYMNRYEKLATCVLIGTSTIFEYVSTLIAYSEEWVLSEESDERLINPSFVLYLFIVINSIDKALLRQKDNYAIYPSSGPLNKKYLENSMVYFTTLHTHSIVDTFGIEANYRKKRTRWLIGSYFDAINIFRKGQIVGYGQVIPEIHRIRIASCDSASVSTSRVRLAIIPFSNFKTFRRENWALEDSDDMSVSYPPDMDDFLKNRISGIVNRIIDKNVDIAILPEYICRPIILEQIESILLIRREKGDNIPILFFTGSQWTHENNNDLFILSSDLRKFRYSKFSPYRNDDVEKFEKLSNPGQYCEIIDINCIGRILPSICRDVIDDHCTDELVKSFHPNYLFTSSWSESITQFFRSYENYTEEYWVTSILCNNCEATCKKAEDKGKYEAGVIYTTGQPKDDRRNRPVKKILESTPVCHEECYENPCFFLVGVDYSEKLIHCGEPSIDGSQIFICK